MNFYPSRSALPVTFLTFIHLFLTDKVRPEDGDSEPQGCSLAPDTARPPADSLHRRL